MCDGEVKLLLTGKTMFDYPLPPLSSGLYAELGLEPDATAEEINEARQELTSRLKSKRKAIQLELDAVYQQVPGLKDATEKLKALESAEAAADEFRKSQLELARLEERAQQLQPNFRALRDEASELESQIHDVNLMPLQNPDDRLNYDRNNPPYELIKLADCGASTLDDPKEILRAVREELSEFFEQAYESVYHPSDLTRQDFVHDFAPDRNLDRDP